MLQRSAMLQEGVVYDFPPLLNQYTERIQGCGWGSDFLSVMFFVLRTARRARGGIHVLMEMQIANEK